MIHKKQKKTLMVLEPDTDQQRGNGLMLVCQMTTKTQIELRKGIYLMPRLKIQTDCKHENNDDNARNNMIKSQYLKVNRHLTNLGEKSVIKWKELTMTVHICVIAVILLNTLNKSFA